MRQFIREMTSLQREEILAKLKIIRGIAETQDAYIVVATDLGKPVTFQRVSDEVGAVIMCHELQPEAADYDLAKALAEVAEAHGLACEVVSELDYIDSLSKEIQEAMEQEPSVQILPTLNDELSEKCLDPQDAMSISKTLAQVFGTKAPCGCPDCMGEAILN